MDFIFSRHRKTIFLPGNLSRTTHTNPKTHPEERAGDVGVFHEHSSHPLLVVVDHGLGDQVNGEKMDRKPWRGGIDVVGFGDWGAAPSSGTSGRTSQGGTSRRCGSRGLRPLADSPSWRAWEQRRGRRRRGGDVGGGRRSYPCCEPEACVRGRSISRFVGTLKF